MQICILNSGIGNDLGHNITNASGYLVALAPTP